MTLSHAELYALNNDRWFDGDLPSIPIRYGIPDGFHDDTEGVTVFDDGRPIAIYLRDLNTSEGVLLHEMAHIFLGVLDADEGAHGPLFRGLVRTIGGEQTAA